jgi:hypothetical protein
MKMANLYLASKKELLRISVPKETKPEVVPCIIQKS